MDTKQSFALFAFVCLYFCLPMFFHLITVNLMIERGGLFKKKKERDGILHSLMKWFYYNHFYLK